ncbi:hypothetical protein ACFPU1_16910 [Thalassorhabdus alkalitolerans]|uniref:AAA domain-containing protein n=1 Tax=Thalassorhabdus alkalitolerans TaxID=2282697 RepID=A0ABW0YUM4_9BACI
MSKLNINKLILLGPSYKRTLVFNKGFNLIRGDRTSGKSLTLQLIDYCFGRSEHIRLKVHKELAKHCDEVFLEISIDDEVITLNRLLKKNKSKISIFFCEFDDIDGYIPKISDIKEVMQYIMRKLNINEYIRTKYKPHSKEQQLDTISFRDIFRYVYIKQHALGTNDFLDNKVTFKKNKNPYAFEMIFDLVEADKDQLSEQLIAAKNNIEMKKREITGLNSYLEDKEASEFVTLISQENQIKREIAVQKSKKTLVIQENNSHKSTENEMYIKLKNRLTTIANQIFDYKRQIKDIHLSIESKKFLLQEYEKEKSETEATLEMNYRLVVNNQRIECPLCHSTVQSHIHHESKPTEKILNKIHRETKNKAKLVQNLIKKDIDKIEKIDAQVASLSKEQAILDNAVGEFSKKTSVPYLSQLDSINSIINSYNREKEIIDECIRVHRKIEEKNKLIEELESEIENLEEDLNGLKASEDEKHKIFKLINEKYKDYMARLKYDTTHTYIDFKEYIPYHDGASVFEHESGGLLECMQISFVAAILSSKIKGYAAGHPGFLLLDSISKYLGTIRSEMDEEDRNRKGRINDPEVYEEIYKIFVELSEYFQLIVVDNTPPSMYISYSEYTFLSGEQGLIDLSVNELDET